MQFGRLIGGSLVLLGILLLCLELSFFVNVGSKPQPRQTVEGSQTPAPKASVLPGVLGGALLIAGAGIFVRARREDEPEAKNAVK